jgi:hypothetical protein
MSENETGSGTSAPDGGVVVPEPLCPTPSTFTAVPVEAIPLGRRMEFEDLLRRKIGMGKHGGRRPRW